MANQIKVREDREIVRLSECKDGVFKVLSDSTGKKKDEDVTIADLRKRVEPWLTALFQSEHLSLLVGTGLTSAACYAAGGEPRAMEDKTFEHYGKQIDKAAEESAKSLGRGTKNFGDTIRVANELLREGRLKVKAAGPAADALTARIQFATHCVAN